MTNEVTGSGSPDDPWVLRTPPGTSEYRMHRDDTADPPELVCQVGTTKLRYLARCIDDVPAMLREHGDWMELGSADENKPAKDGTLEAWARSDANPVGGWYGLRKGYRGLRDVRPAIARAPRPGRARTQRSQQPGARDLTVRDPAAGVTGSG
jgi:hypothetical protein